MGHLGDRPDGAQAGVVPRAGDRGAAQERRRHALRPGRRRGSVNGHRVLEHSGEVSGFTAENIVLPDDGIAVAVLTNQDAAVGGGRRSAGASAGAARPRQDANDAQRTALARKVFDGLQHGHHRPIALHRQRERVFHRSGAQGFRGQPRPLGHDRVFTPDVGPGAAAG